MSELTVPRTLTPLERFQLRDSLQDRWREVVTRITELSIEFHTLRDAAGDTAPEAEVEAISWALSDARLQLAEIEQAMRRLDQQAVGGVPATAGR